jgi:hypothetical protein
VKAKRFELALEAVDRVIERAPLSGKYPKDETWRGVPIAEHFAHARAHLELLIAGEHIGTAPGARGHADSDGARKLRTAKPGLAGYHASGGGR